jgi:hypothetical protein
MGLERTQLGADLLYIWVDIDAFIGTVAELVTNGKTIESHLI